MPSKTKETAAHYYDRRGVLGELVGDPAEFSLEEELREQILSGRRTRRLENISIKLDPAHIVALRKIATTKAVPYQTLIRQWLAEAIHRELALGERARHARRGAKGSRRRALRPAPPKA